MLKKIWRTLSGRGEAFFSQDQIVLMLASALGIYHACLLVLYTYYGMTILSVLNFFSVLLYVACTVAARLKVKAIHILRVCYAEIIVQVLVAGIMLGHQCGFQFYLIAITCYAFYIGYIYRGDERISAMHYVLIGVVVFIILRIGNTYIPQVYTFRDPWVVDSLYAVNFFTAVVAIVIAMGNMLSQIINLENRLLQKNRNLEVLSHTDALTGLANRRSVEEKFHYVMEHSKMYAVILADIDDFKRINDSFGHNVGDRVLQQVAEIFQNAVRGDDMVCRWGGEEILVFLPLCKKAGAELTAKRIMDRIRKACVTSEDGTDIYFSMTFGVADHSEGEGLRGVVQKADARLYVGKGNGKNCVVSE